MMKNIYELFRYDETNTYLHRLDPRSKLFVTTLYLSLVIILNDIYFLTLTFIVIQILIIIGRVYRKFLRGLLSLSPLLLFILFLNYLTLHNLYISLLPVMRFVLFLAVMNMFFLTTNPDDFALTLEKLHMPLTVSLSFMLALRFIPTMANQVTEIIEAQLSRGLKLDRGGFLTRIKNFLPILIPLIILSIKRSIEVAESLEIRGVYPGVKKTSYVTLKTTKNDYIFIFLNITVVLIIYILSIHYPTILTQYMVLL